MEKILIKIVCFILFLIVWLPFLALAGLAWVKGGTKSEGKILLFSIIAVIILIIIGLIKEG